MARTWVNRLRGFNVLIALCVTSGVAGAQPQTGQCTAAGPLVQLPGVAEASGLAASRRTPGRFWTHNDSGQPVLVALDSGGAVSGEVRVSGAKVEDWEAIAVGPCDGGSCLYIGDIGDNEAQRRRITVYQVPEPASASGSAAVSAVFHATYPDGAHDAETLLIAGGRLHIVTKGETGPVAIYRFPPQLQPGAAVRLERVAELSSKTNADSRITDGAASADGQWVVLRSQSRLMFYRTADFLSGHPRVAATIDVQSVKEPQGEGVAFGPDNSVFLAGEGGDKGKAGTFARLSCNLPKR